jgi:16S rRNA U516 pseudouridylate synthase RsuA-like enzyme
MVEAVDAKVRELVRVRIGPVGIGTLPPGGWRALTDEEVESLGGTRATRRRPSGHRNPARRT